MWPAGPLNYTGTYSETNRFCQFGPFHIGLEDGSAARFWRQADNAPARVVAEVGQPGTSRLGLFDRGHLGWSLLQLE
jgi:hypothetical protein